MKNGELCCMEKTINKKNRGKTTLDSSEIYYRCQRGDQEAWTIMYRIIYKNVAEVLRKKPWYTVDSIEDMAQDIVCFLLSGGIDKVGEPVAFFSFVKTVTWRRIVDGFRKKFPLPLPIGSTGDDNKPAWDPPCSNFGPEDLVRGAFFFENILKGLSQLSQKCRKPVTEYIAYKKEGKYGSYEQLAAALNMKIGTLSSLVTRCLEKLSQLPDIRVWLEA